MFDRALGGYKHSLQWVWRHQLLILLVTITTAGLSVYLYTKVPTGFFPQQDTGRIVGSVQAAQDISFPAMREKMVRLTNLARQDPADDTVRGFAGASSTHTGRTVI